jgi:hypothetical protein
MTAYMRMGYTYSSHKKTGFRATPEMPENPKFHKSICAIVFLLKRIDATD